MGLRFARDKEAIEAVERDLEPWLVSVDIEQLNPFLPFAPEVLSLLRTLVPEAGTTVDLEMVLRKILTATSGPAARSLARSNWGEILRL